MGTTQFFDEKIVDQKQSNHHFLEFGRSSYYEEQSMYITINDETVIVDRATAKRIVDAMNDCSSYLRLQDD